jgi:hypothetical protein
MWFFKRKDGNKRKKLKHLYYECIGYLTRMQIQSTGFTTQANKEGSYMNFQVYNHRDLKTTKFVLLDPGSEIVLQVFWNDVQGQPCTTKYRINRLQDFTREIHNAKI